MAYGTSVSPIGSKPVKKRKPKSLTSDLAVRSSVATSKPAGSTYSSKNTTSNTHAGQMYRSRVTSKGVVHQYANGDNVLVKKSKTANPSRSLHDPNPTPQITEDDPRWDARTMGNKTGIGRDGNYYKNGKRVPRYSGRRGRPSR